METVESQAVLESRWQLPDSHWPNSNRLSNTKITTDDTVQFERPINMSNSKTAQRNQ